MKLLKYSLLLILIVTFHSNNIKSQILSERAEISLITSNPGTEIYIYFGHSAIRVKDPLKGIDWVYNYGTFDFNTPNFYTKFARGYLNYKLSVYPMRYFVQENRHENRSIYEQVLNLNQEEKELVFRFLENNRQPGNEYYLYDFFFDNCATRIRDVFQDELGKDLVFDEAIYEPITFREMLAPYLEPHAWSRFGINLVLGAIADRKATLAESTFLPGYLKTAFANAKLNNKDFAQPSKILFQQKDVDLNTSIFLRPGFVFVALLLIILFFTYREFKTRKTYKLIDFFVFLFIGIIGLILFLLWTATSHTAVVKNWNLIWAIPTHFFIVVFIFRKAKSVYLKYYFLVSGILAISVFGFLVRNSTVNMI
ncbi:MAG: DUF4105 domain-containing protein [Chloroflexia bacterium]|nr:DUF4105 domain-containing protein [Chloroflexia bacterium]